MLSPILVLALRFFDFDFGSEHAMQCLQLVPKQERLQGHRLVGHNCALQQSGSVTVMHVWSSHAQESILCAQVKRIHATACCCKLSSAASLLIVIHQLSTHLP
eukprot:1160987-Pelagomonas_calceolata.AAC.5